MRGETEIIVRGEVNDLSMVEGRRRLLFALENPQLPIQTLLFECVELGREVGEVPEPLLHQRVCLEIPMRDDVVEVEVNGRPAGVGTTTRGGSPAHTSSSAGPHTSGFMTMPGPPP